MLQTSLDRYNESTKAESFPKRYPVETMLFPTYSTFCACGCRKEIREAQYWTWDGEPLASQKCVDEYYAEISDELKPMKEAV